jgi:hypothetical protein
MIEHVFTVLEFVLDFSFSIVGLFGVAAILWHFGVRDPLILASAAVMLGYLPGMVLDHALPVPSSKRSKQRRSKLRARTTSPLRQENHPASRVH